MSTRPVFNGSIREYILIAIAVGGIVLAVGNWKGVSDVKITTLQDSINEIKRRVDSIDDRQKQAVDWVRSVDTTLGVQAASLQQRNDKMNEMLDLEKQLKTDVQANKTSIDNLWNTIRHEKGGIK